MQKEECRLFITNLNSNHNIDEENKLSLEIEKNYLRFLSF